MPTEPWDMDSNSDEIIAAFIDSLSKSNLTEYFSKISDLNELFSEINRY